MVILSSAAREAHLNECSCPDAQHREVECKHRLAVKLHMSKLQANQPRHRSRHQHPVSPEQADRASAEAIRLEMELERRAANAAEYHRIWGRDE